MSTGRARPQRPKVPERRDSRDVVEAIVAAATEILAEGKMNALTTNRVAERAGVGVASVYRYFRDKGAIVAEIDLRNRRANSELILTALANVERDFTSVVRIILRHFLDTKDARSRIRRALMTEVPLSWVAGPASESWSQTLAAATYALSELRPDLPSAEVERRIFITFHAVQGIATGQLVFPHGDMDIDEAVAHVERLVVPFLLAPPP